MSTKPDLKPIPPKLQFVIARLLQLHYETHPKRISAAVGLSSAYCKRLWSALEKQYWPDSRMALAVYAEMKRELEPYLLTQVSSSSSPSLQQTATTSPDARATA